MVGESLFSALQPTLMRDWLCLAPRLPSNKPQPPPHHISSSVSSLDSDDFGLPHSSLVKMAQKAKKDRAKSNTTALNNLHIGTAVVHALFLAFHFLLRSRSLVTYGLLSAPSLICEYVLESSGRPKYDSQTKALIKSGEDLNAPGLTEYMFDVIWVTWASLVAVIVFGNWGWLLWALVPAYGLYMASGLLGMGRQKMAQMQGAGDAQAQAPQGNRRSRRAA